LELVAINTARKVDALCVAFASQARLAEWRPIDVIRTGRAEELLAAIRAERASSYA
jgi:hypothetical protein